MHGALPPRTHLCPYRCTDMYTQGHFAYDSHKGGGVTMSHLRFGPEEIKSEFEIKNEADYIACGNTSYV